MADVLASELGRSTGSRYGRLESVDLTPQIQSGTTRNLLFRFEIELNAHKPAATEAMEAIIVLLRNTLEQQFEQHKERIAKRMDQVERQAAEAEVEVRKLQEQLRELSSSKALNRDPLMEEISRSEEQIRKFKMEKELNGIQMDRLYQQIEEAKKNTVNQISGDAVLRDLEKMLKIAEERVAVAEKMVAAGQANQNAVQDAMEKLMRANIELAQRRELLGASAGTERINDLLKRISELSLREAQNEIQLKHLNDRIAQSRLWLNQSVDYEILNLRLDLAREKLREALRRAASIRNFQPEPPTVEALGAN